MSSFLKNTHKLTLVLSALFLVITLTAGSFAVVTQGFPEKAAKAEAVEAEDTFPVFDSEPVFDVEPMSYTSGADKLNAPSHMDAVVLSAGKDFLKSKDASAETLRTEADTAVNAAKKAGVNTVIIDTRYDGGAIYQSASDSGLDLMGYIVEKCREESLYAYAVIDVSSYSGGGESADILAEDLTLFCDAYAVDGILLDGCYQAAGQSSYAEYMVSGGSIGFDNYIKGTPSALVKTAVNAIRKAAPGMQAGLMASVSDNADSMLGLIDFAALKTEAADEGLAEAVRLWSGRGMPVYAVFSSKGDKLTKEMDEAAKGGVAGNIFSGLEIAAGADLGAAKTASSDNPLDNPANVPVPEKKQDKPLAEVVPVAATARAVTLNVTKPEKTSYTTFEQYVTFSGAADPALPLTINGRRAEVDKGGYFSATNKLEIGQNVFVITQNGVEKKYTITRQVQLIKEISPTGVIMAESDMSITITAVAYSEANVYAVINGEKVPMSVDSSASLNDSDGGFEIFTGEYIAPESDDEVLILGGVTVCGSYNGQNEVMEGAYLKVNAASPKVPADGLPVVVAADQAKTYSAKTADNVPDPTLYPLPKGARDYMVGNSIVYKKNKNETFTYAMLASGVRVETKDLRKQTAGPSNNSVSKLTVEEPGDGFTYIRLSMKQQVSYKFLYRGDRVEISLNYTSGTPNSGTLTANELFSRAEWEDGGVLVLKLNKAGCFMGYKGYYDDGDLVFRFNQIPSSIKTARIAIDPGHGGKDPGTLGYRKDLSEREIVRSISEILAEDLESRGATVKLLESANYQGPERAQMAEAFKADIFVSIHANSSANTAATGTEVYYFNSYSRALAQSAAANVSKQLSTLNRGPRPSYYHVTLSPQMPSVLIETGFLSNKTEYEKLITASYQKRVATGVADSIEAALMAARTGSTSATATATTVVAENTSTAVVYPDESFNDYGISLKDAGEPFIDEDYLEVYKGNFERVNIISEDGTVIKNADFTWKSNKTNIVSVDKNGVVRAKNAGTATITATSGNYELYCDVEVTTTKVALTSITLTKEAVTVVRGKTQQLTAKLLPEKATDKNLVWRSSDNIVATVDSKGVVKGVNPGKATISVRNSTGTLVSKCSVEVVRTDVNIEEIEMDDDRLEMAVKDKEELLITLYPENVTVTKVKWTSSNPAVVKVDAKGNITALKKGEAVVRVESAESKRIYAECEIKVFD